MEKSYYDVDEISQYLGVSAHTVRYWYITRQIPCFKIGRHVKFRLQEVEKWIEQKRLKQVA